MRHSKPLLFLAALAASLVAGVSAPAALADCVSDATVSYVGADWGPTPLWRVSVPGASWDVAANSADEALSKVGPMISCPAPPAAPVATVDPPVVAAPVVVPPVDAPPAPAGSPAPPSDLATGQATQLVTEATVTYVGNSWGPLPVWRVNVPSRNASYDVAATSADAARAAVLGTVASDIDRNPVVAPVVVPASQGPSLAASTGNPVQVDTSAVAPFSGVVAKTPAKSKTAKKGVHSTPATAKAKAR